MANDNRFLFMGEQEDPGVAEFEARGIGKVYDGTGATRERFVVTAQKLDGTWCHRVVRPSEVEQVLSAWRADPELVPESVRAERKEQGHG